MLECQIEIQVEWGHCDPAQIVYNPNYSHWMERGLARLFEAAGFSFDEIVAHNPDLRGAPLVRSNADYIAPARIGDVITLTSKITRWGKSSFDITHEFNRRETRLVTATQTRVWAGNDPQTGDLKALPIPDDVRAALSEPRKARYRIAYEDGDATA